MKRATRTRPLTPMLDKSWWKARLGVVIKLGSPDRAIAHVGATHVPSFAAVAMPQGRVVGEGT